MKKSKSKNGFRKVSILRLRFLQTEIPKDSPVDCSRCRSDQESNSREEMIAVRGAPISFPVNRWGEFIRMVFHEDISGIRHEDLLGHQWFPQGSRCIMWI